MQNRALQQYKPVERPIRVVNGIRATTPKVKKVISCVPIPRRAISPVLRQAAERIRTMGFTAMFGSANGPACFVGSINFAIRKMRNISPSAVGFEEGWTYDVENLWEIANDFVEILIFNQHGFDSDTFNKGSLEAEGWTARDAAAALDLAADYAEAIGR